MLGLPLSAVHRNEPTHIKKKRGRPSKAELALRQQEQQHQEHIVQDVNENEANEEGDGEVYEVEAIKGMRLSRVE